MTVKELIKQLETFDKDLPVVVIDTYDANIPQRIETTRWEFDGKCKIVIDSQGS